MDTREWLERAQCVITASHQGHVCVGQQPGCGTVPGVLAVRLSGRDGNGVHKKGSPLWVSQIRVDNLSKLSLFMETSWGKSVEASFSLPASEIRMENAQLCSNKRVRNPQGFLQSFQSAWSERNN